MLLMFAPDNRLMLMMLGAGVAEDARTRAG